MWIYVLFWGTRYVRASVSTISDGLSAVVGLVAPNPHSPAVDTDVKRWLGGNRGLVKHNVWGPADCDLRRAGSGNYNGPMGPTVGLVSISCSGLAGLLSAFCKAVGRETYAWLVESWTKVELRPPCRWECRTIDVISGRPSSSGLLTTSVGVSPRAAKALLSSPVAYEILTSLDKPFSIVTECYNSSDLI